MSVFELNQYLVHSNSLVFIFFSKLLDSNRKKKKKPSTKRDFLL